MEEDDISEGPEMIIDNDSDDDDINEEITEVLGAENDWRKVGDITACITCTGDITTKKQGNYQKNL